MSGWKQKEENQEKEKLLLKGQYYFLFFFLTFSQVHPNWAKPRLVFDKFFIKQQQTQKNPGHQSNENDSKTGADDHKDVMEAVFVCCLGRSLDIESVKVWQKLYIDHYEP